MHIWNFAKISGRTPSRWFHVLFACSHLWKSTTLRCLRSVHCDACLRRVWLTFHLAAALWRYCSRQSHWEAAWYLTSLWPFVWASLLCGCLEQRATWDRYICLICIEHFNKTVEVLVRCLFPESCTRKAEVGPNDYVRMPEVTLKQYCSRMLVGIKWRWESKKCGRRNSQRWTVAYWRWRCGLLLC